MSIFFENCTAITCNKPGSSQKKESSSKEIASIAWIDSVISLGEIKMGDTVSFRFRFKNTGTKPLIISLVETSCSCTVANYTGGAIPPNGVSEIHAMFDTRKSIVGFVRKTILVTANTLPANKQLLYSAEITGHKQIINPQ